MVYVFGCVMVKWLRAMQYTSWMHEITQNNDKYDNKATYDLFYFM